MRRKEREVNSDEGLEEILACCKVCRIATQDEDGLYIVPVNFGYCLEGGKLSLFLHSAKEGRKVSAFAKGGQVAFEMDCDHRFIQGETACASGFAYASIIGQGKISLVEDLEEKKRALSLLMQHQSGREYTFGEREANSVFVYRIDALQFTGKRHA